MDRTSQWDLQHVGLATACSVIYSKVTGVRPAARKPQEMQSILNDVARALASLGPIYAAQPGLAVPRALDAGELVGGQFVRGAHAFKTSKGEELVGLTIQRRDMRLAISILTSARIAFRPPQ